MVFIFVISPVHQALPNLLPRLWRFALRLTRDTANAEDLLQKTCARALEKQQQFTEGSNALAWTMSIMHSIWVNDLRRTARQGQAVFLDELADEENPAQAQVVAQELFDSLPKQLEGEQMVLFRQVIEQVEALPHEQRHVLFLVAVEGLSYAEAAQVMGVALGTVMSRLSRARTRLKEVLGDEPKELQ